MAVDHLTLDDAMLHALELAERGPVTGPNPRVGCVLLAPRAVDPTAPRQVLARGWHRGAGTPHAEADALAQARADQVDVHGATAVVTLEPCNHTGRTGPCAQALVDAGIAEVLVAVTDPNPQAAGGSAYLRAHGVSVVEGVHAAEGAELLRVWLSAVRSGRPFVTLKTATSLDGRVAAVDGSSRWITGPQSRAHAHAVRATVDAIVVGTGTVWTDDPELTARTAGGALAEHQPLRVVVGNRDLPTGARVGQGVGALHLRTHDVHEVLTVLAEREVRSVLVEGGPTLATAFLVAGVVDELHAYVAPVILGAGKHAIGDLGGRSITQALRFSTTSVTRLGDDALVVSRPRASSTSRAGPSLGALSGASSSGG